MNFEFLAKMSATTFVVCIFLGLDAVGASWCLKESFWRKGYGYDPDSWVPKWTEKVHKVLEGIAVVSLFLCSSIAMIAALILVFVLLREVWR